MHRATVKASGKTKGVTGLPHILEARQRKDGLTPQLAMVFLGNMVEVIAHGGKVHRTIVGASERVGVATNDAIAWLVRPQGSNGWVVTAYKPDETGPGGAPAGRATDAPTLGTASLTRSDEGAGSDAISGQNGAPPLFSRSPAQMAAGAGATIKRFTVTNVKNKMVDYLGLALQALGRRQILDCTASCSHQA